MENRLYQRLRIQMLLQEIGRGDLLEQIRITLRSLIEQAEDILRAVEKDPYEYSIYQIESYLRRALSVTQDLRHSMLELGYGEQEQQKLTKIAEVELLLRKTCGLSIDIIRDFIDGEQTLP